MATSGTLPSRVGAWRDLYLGALMEANKAKTPARIAEAERAMIDRARELFKISGDHIQEEEALDDALYALRALKNCLGYTTDPR